MSNKINIFSICLKVSCGVSEGTDACKELMNCVFLVSNQKRIAQQAVPYSHTEQDKSSGH